MIQRIFKNWVFFKLFSFNQTVFPVSTEIVVKISVENVRLAQHATLHPVCVQMDARTTGYFLIVQVIPSILYRPVEKHTITKRIEGPQCLNHHYAYAILNITKPY